MLSLFLGAGFSKWAFDLPLVNDLFDFDIEPTSELEMRRLLLIENDWKEWRANNLNITPERFVYWCMNKSSHRKSRIIWYISRRLSEPFMTKIRGGLTSAMFDERRIRENPRIVELRCFFEQLLKKGLTSVITCNYDTIVECILGTKKFNYGVQGEQLVGRGINPQFPWQNAHLKVMGELPLIKLHGSLSWDENKKYTSGKLGKAGKSFIVPPAPEKLAPDELADVWQLGAELLVGTRFLIVFGFAFNPYDEALLNFLKQHTKNVENVLLVDPFPNFSAAKKLWSNCNIRSVDPRNNNLLDLALD
ncbi:hypothetical protein D5018_17980 [Parashewanella curva]|uniref:SIR2-like domain-containing protein n=1 Tax=Parashewanella curva TaxID=2338552 RepID=A0A3L8PU08_9GAMM|nr:hypothetical protein [Parashewanella curva]RLV58299.1 hypothetical protein D5018_17980 [Parashewanella curva]